MLDLNIDESQYPLKSAVKIGYVEIDDNNSMFLHLSLAEDNLNEYFDIIPFHIKDGFMAADAFNSFEIEEDEALLQLFDDLNHQLREKISLWVENASVDNIVIKDDEIYFNLNLGDIALPCLHHEKYGDLLVREDQNSFTYKTEMYDECNFVCFKDIETIFKKELSMVIASESEDKINLLLSPEVKTQCVTSASQDIKQLNLRR